MTDQTVDSVGDRLSTLLTNGRRSLVNAARVLTGIDAPKTAQHGKSAAWTSGTTNLWHFHRDTPPTRETVVIVFSLVTRSYVFDLAPGNSFVEALIDEGYDVYLVDWGEPSGADADRDLAVHCDEMLPTMLRVAADRRGEDVLVFGYCLGGLLAMLTSAGNPDLPIRGLAVAATPLRLEELGPMGRMVASGRIVPSNLFNSDGNLPAPVLRNAFRTMQPGVELVGYANLLEHLHDDRFVASWRTMTGWGNDHIAMPGAVVVDLTELARTGTLPEGTARVGDRSIDFAQITVPFLSIRGSRDHLVPPESTGELTAFVGSELAVESVLPVGHVGMFLGRSGRKTTIPALRHWADQIVTRR